ASQAQVVYRVPEPVVDASSGPGPHALAGTVPLPFSYPDGPHDAESLMVDPTTGDLVIVAKNLGATPVFRFPAPQSTSVTPLEQIAAPNFSQPPLSGWLATGGDISASGDEILIRTYFSAFVWTRSPGQSLAQALAGAPCPVPLAAEPQGEAIAYAADTGSYFSLSERGSSGPQPLTEYGCAHGLSDVPGWVADAVEWLVCAHHATGYPDQTFRPDRSITRAQTARMLHRIAGSPDPGDGSAGCGLLSDVPVWAADAVCWLVNSGHATGYPDQTFRPDRSITRAQTARMLHRIHV
ncbi:MAG: S-layer homology domain-containing protein, partial [Ilumatobacteraceae bacterium]